MTQTVHIMGIGGFGMSAIARLMNEHGHAIYGCELAESPLVTELRSLGIPIALGHDPAHIDAFNPDALVISSAVPAENAEVQAARARGIPIYKRADVLGTLMNGRTGVAVAGTHGKTTTTAMIAHILTQAGADQSYLIGGIPADLGTTAHAGSGPAFVVEADEYDGMFLGLRPSIIVLTTLELDHPDMFSDLAAMRSLYGRFLDRLPPDGTLIAGIRDKAARTLIEGRGAITYDIGRGDWQALNLRPNVLGGVDFTVVHRGRRVADASLSLPGEHTATNALAAIIAAEQLGTDPAAAVSALGTFSGVGRRFEIKGIARDVIVIDDYAHHPTAIRATLAAARSRYPNRRIWAVWQPHTYSRTAALLAEFAASFDDADHVIIMDVFRSRDTHDYGVSPISVLERMPRHPDARHVGTIAATTGFLAAHVEPGDVVIVMSAGDATRVTGGLLAALGKPIIGR
ncbi:MAG: UDP-N-acetylmuramate--L-alanine ligase [Anaerolineae bacterium]